MKRTIGCRGTPTAARKRSTPPGTALLSLCLGSTLLACEPQSPVVRDSVKIGGAEDSGLELSADDVFGRSVLGLGDWNLDGVPDVAVGAVGDDEAGRDHGALWVLFLGPDGGVEDVRKITGSVAGFTDPLGEEYGFGVSVTTVGDLDGDGLPELAVGGAGAQVEGQRIGAVWILSLDRDAQVRWFQRIDGPGGSSGLTNPEPGDTFFGISAAGLGDVDGDGVGDLAVGARRDSEGGRWRGAVWILFLNADGSLKDARKISSASPGLAGALDDGDELGQSVAGVGDLNGDGVPDLAAGAFRDDDGGENRGAVWILYLDRDGSVKSRSKISQTSGRFAGRLRDFDMFGSGLAVLGDLDSNGTVDLAVGARRTDDGVTDAGAMWLLLLEDDGTVRASRKVSQTTGGFGHELGEDDQFGYQVAGLGDLDGDGIPDIAAGAIFDDEAGFNAGAVYLLYLAADWMP